MQEDRISRGVVLKSCHFHNLLCVPQPIIYIISPTLGMYTGKIKLNQYTYSLFSSHVITVSFHILTSSLLYRYPNIRPRVISGTDSVVK